MQDKEASSLHSWTLGLGLVGPPHSQGTSWAFTGGCQFLVHLADSKPQAKGGKKTQTKRIRYARLSRTHSFRRHQAGFENTVKLTQLCMISFQLLEILYSVCRELSECYYSAGWCDLHILKQNSAERVWAKQRELNINLPSCFSPYKIRSECRLDLFCWAPRNPDSLFSVFSPYALCNSYVKRRC